MINAILGLTIAFLPLFSRFSFVNFERTAKNNLLALVLVATLPFMGKRLRELPKSLVVAFVYFVAMAALNHHNIVSVYVMIHSFYLVIGLAFWAMYYQGFDGKTLKYVYCGMITGSLVQCAFILSRLLGFDAYPLMVTIITGASSVSNDPDMIMGTLGNSNLVGAYLALTVPAFMALPYRWSWLMVIPMSCVFVSDSLMAICTLLAALAYPLLKNFKKYLYISASLAMLAAFLFVEGHDSQRFYLWSQNLSIVDIEHLIFGAGPGWFQDQQFKLVGGVVALEEHNEFLAFFNWFGAIGLALLLPSFIKFIKAKDQSAIMPAILFGAFINAFGHFNLHQSGTLIIILISSAVCIAEGNNHVIDV